MYSARSRSEGQGLPQGVGVCRCTFQLPEAVCRSADAKSGSLHMSALWIWEIMCEAQTCHGLAVDPLGCGQQLLAVDHWKD